MMNAEITVHEFKAMSEGKEDFQLIDVREGFEIEIASIGGLHIPMNEVINELEKIDKDKPVMVYCRSGRRSAVIIDHIQQITGHDNLYNLAGGILDWSEKIDNTIRQY